MDQVLMIENNTDKDDDCGEDNDNGDKADDADDDNDGDDVEYDDVNDNDENVTIKKAERLSRSLLPALSITTAANKVATISIIISCMIIIIIVIITNIIIIIIIMINIIIIGVTFPPSSSLSSVSSINITTSTISPIDPLSQEIPYHLQRMEFGAEIDGTEDFFQVIIIRETINEEEKPWQYLNCKT